MDIDIHQDCKLIFIKIVGGNDMENTTVDFATWKKSDGNKDIMFWDGIRSFPAFSDINGIELLNQYIEGYMTKPVELYNDKAIAAKVVKYNDFDKMKFYFETNNNKIFVFQLLWKPSFPIYFLDEKLLTPIFSDGFWFVRLAEVE
jgi:hypothetical protein